MSVSQNSPTTSLRGIRWMSSFQGVQPPETFLFNYLNDRVIPSYTDSVLSTEGMSIRLRRSLTLLSIPFTAWLYPQLKSEAPHPNQKQCRQKVASTSRVVRQGVRIPSRSTESLFSKPLLTTHTYVFQSVTVRVMLCFVCWCLFAVCRVPRAK